MKKMKRHWFLYAVTDCEQEGDIEAAVGEVIRAGGEVCGTEWDGKDCGEAYVIVHGDDPARLRRYA